MSESTLIRTENFCVRKFFDNFFLKIFKGNLISVRDDNQSYSYEQEKEIADREVEQITNDENGVHVLLVKDNSIPVVDFLSICCDDVIRVYDTKLKTTTRVSREEAMRGLCNYKVTEYTVYDGCLVISVKHM